MAIQIVMDRTGDSRHLSTRTTNESSRRRSSGSASSPMPASPRRSGPGQASQIRSFDPNAEETVFFPRLVGG